MAVDLVNPPPNLSPQAALSISQKAPQLLKSGSVLPWPLSLLTNDDTPEQWTIYENLFLSCLRTGDDQSAHAILKKLRDRFGPKNERVMTYQSMYDEARASSPQDIVNVLKRLNDGLEEDPTNLQLLKRRIAILRSKGRLDEATTQLVSLLKASPIDAEAWSELADLYLVQSNYEQSIYCLEEVLLSAPNAWAVHARLGETIYLSSLATLKDNERDRAKALAESMRRFCRSIELCNNYLRGYYGLKLVARRLLEILPKATAKATGTSDSPYSDLPLPAVSVVEKLDELATSKLGEIVRRGSAAEKGWDGYDEAELIAARELLDRDSKSVR